METPNLAAALADEDEALRTFAAEDAAEANLEGDVAPLIARLVVEGSCAVREALVSALMRITDASVARLVPPLLTSEEAFVRNAAVRILRGRVEQALTSLEPMISGGNPDVRKFIVDIAAASPCEGATALLVSCLADRDVNVRIAAIEALGDRRARAAAPAISRAISEEQEPMLLASALTALESVGDETCYRTLEERFPRLSDVPAVLAIPLLRVLARYGPPSSVDRIVDEAARLAGIYPADALDVLEVMHDRFGFPAVRPAVWDRLAHLASSAWRPVDRFRLLKWFGKLREQPGVTTFLIGKLDNPEPMVRLGAVVGLRHAGGGEARSALTGRLGAETHDDVRNAMEDALRSLSR